MTEEQIYIKKRMLDAEVELLQRELEQLLQRENSILAKKKEIQKSIAAKISEMLEIKTGFFSSFGSIFQKIKK